MSAETPILSKAAFLDRDGVINIDKGYVCRWEDFQFIEGVLDGLHLLQDLGYRLVIITNQSAVARDFCSIDDVRKLSAQIEGYLGGQGIRIAGTYFCPHHPEGKVAEFTRICNCRKPAPGLIMRACDDLGIDLKNSVLIGDKQSDVEAAHNAGVARTFLVSSRASGGFKGLLDCAKFLARC